MSIVDQLVYIRKNRQQGNIRDIAELSGLNEGLISNYIKNGHRMVLKRIYAEKIINAYKILKDVPTDRI